MELLKEHQDKINWRNLSKNPNIFEIDYNALRERNKDLKREIIEKVMHPKNIIKYLEMEYDLEDLL